ncbi:LuxR C-terminal-related transcriptional regulator [uncultured Microbacterium sp.]|uniref:helix-turn-helix transcriptional regulator n=1 Tax=uncultured Microbacterium sp. TaxID=191216 RepID=UPI0028D55CB0|nr:LuxR C-terminal-related transcriptional regulator [uncultured Microbacterium sp.]
MGSAHSDGGEQARSAALAALARARSELAGGSVERAWRECLAAAAGGRDIGDAAIVAEAAMLIPGPQVGSHHLTTARQSLCIDALGMLGTEDPALRRRLEIFLAGLSSGWTPSPSMGGSPMTEEEAEDRLLELRAAHTGALAPSDTERRFEIATAMRDTARAARRDDDTAWAVLWRLDALAQLGRRAEMTSDIIELGEVVRRLDSPHWRWRTAMIRATTALMDDHLDDVPSLGQDALRLGAAAGVEEARFIDLILRANFALRTGEDLDAIEVDVRRALADAPFLAQGWRARILVEQGRLPEAREIWRALSPHLDAVPPTALEWLVATTGHAELSIVNDDRPAAAHLYDMLLPHQHLHVMPSIITPYNGPVALYLGELAEFLGRTTSARTHLGDALLRSEDMHAPASSQRARAAIARLGEARHPLFPLSAREAEVAELVATGKTNREVAHRLFLSERTVENHVSSILRRLELPNRAAVASWVARRRTEDRA